MSSEATYLPHLSAETLKESGYSSSRFCSFAIPREAYFRGLTVCWYLRPDYKKIPCSGYMAPHTDGDIYSIDDGSRVYYLNKTRVISEQASKSEQRLKKNALKALLAKIGVGYPDGRVFKRTESAEVMDYVQQLHFPVVIKPVGGSMGEGVFANLRTQEDVHLALQAQKKDSVIVEKHVDGDEYRAYIVGGKLLGVCLRVAPEVIGDGKSDVQELIQHKNHQKEKNNLAKINVDNSLLALLRMQKLDLTSVLPIDAVARLSHKLGRSSGGDIVECTDSFSTKYKKELELVARRCPGLFVLGIDFIISEGSLFVIEINSRPQISSILFPDSGMARDLPKQLIDSLFPDSKRIVEPNDEINGRAIINKMKKLKVNSFRMNIHHGPGST